MTPVRPNIATPTMRLTALPQRQSLVAKVVEQLVQHIESGAVAPGERLPAESELCQMLEVSRTVVREAVSQLKADELVESQPGLGLYVARRPPGQGVLRLRAPGGSRRDNARDLLEFRAGLETQAARLAALRRGPDDIAAMRLALAQLDAAEREQRNGGTEDFQFHMAIANASKNSYIVQALRFLSASVQDAISHSRHIEARDTLAQHLQAARHEHVRLLEAIVDGAPDLATLQMQRHLAAGQLRLLAAAPPDDDDAHNATVS